MSRAKIVKALERIAGRGYLYAERGPRSASKSDAAVLWEAARLLKAEKAQEARRVVGWRVRYEWRNDHGYWIKSHTGLYALDSAWDFAAILRNKPVRVYRNVRVLRVTKPIHPKKGTRRERKEDRAEAR